MNKIFQDPTTTVPRDDPQFVRVPYSGSDIGGRKDHIPVGKSTEAQVSHVATAKTGSK